MHVSMCTVCKPGPLGGQRRALVPLEMELLVVMSCHMSAGT